MKQTLCLGMLVCGALAAANLPQPKFAARRDYTSATGFVAVADVNGDGIPDVVTAYETAIYTLLGNGDGTFRDGPAGIPGGGHSVNALVPIDLNGDGKLDLVVASDNGIGICFGNGDGSFQPAIYYTAKGGGPGSIAVGDFNRDQIPDVVMVNASGIILYSGKGGGVFAQGVFTPIAPNGASLGATIVAADFNQDGKLDLALSVGYDLKPGERGFVLLFGNGDGTFQKPAFHATAGVWPQWLATADLNRTGRADIVAYGGAATAYIFLNNGMGQFSAPTQSSLPGTQAGQFAIGDVNGDHIPDLVSSSGYVALGLGKAQFAPAVNYPVAYHSDYVTLGDLRGNGRLDVVTGEDYGNNNAVSVLLNKGNGTFQDGAWTPVTDSLNCGAAADFNGDGKADLAVLAANGIDLLLGTGKASAPYVPGTTLAVSGAGCPFSGDVNGDGIPDLLVWSSELKGVAVFLGNGDGTFQMTSVVPATSFYNLVLADFNRDGKVDLALSSNQLALGNGDGTFQAPQPFAAHPPEPGFNWIAAGDLNSDGWIDLFATTASRDGSGAIFVLLNNQKGGFGESAFSQGDSVSGVTLADLNRDGNLDAVVVEDTAAVDVYMGDGHGSFQLLTGGIPYPGNGTSIPLIGDVNGDGIPDVLLAADGSIGVALGQGNGTFSTPVVWGAGSNVRQIFLENLHGQSAKAGMADVVAPDNGGVLVLINTTK